MSIARLWVSVLVTLGLAAPVRAQFADPFSVSAEFRSADAEAPRLSVRFQVPPDHYLYAESVEVEAEPPARIVPLDRPEPIVYEDPFTGEPTQVYKADFTLEFEVSPADLSALTLSVAYQGCNETICFMPTLKELNVSLGTTTTHGTEKVAARDDLRISEVPAETTAEPWREAAEGFRVAARTTGYVPVDDFLMFLDRAETDRPEAAGLAQLGLLAMVGAILLGGLALNLTPCVLPMIPINLAIIGAGAQAGSRRRGFALGATYGGAIAFVYGALGLVVLLTGARFGTLNASPWFNFAIAVIFVALSLAMFGVFNIDLSALRNRAGGGQPRRGGGFALAGIMGAVAALLAGACVAPVVISVLLLAGQLYGEGQPLALALPFVLGLGMALPWPFAGAGLSFLPKPGAWMKWVKGGFGVLILVFALYYAHLGWSLLDQRLDEQAAAEMAELQSRHAEEGGWFTSLDAALAEARRRRAPVFVDFWASWCKNCLTMEKTTFRDPRVQERLEPYVKLKYRAEQPNRPPAKAVLDHYEVLGLPTYLILEPTARP